MKLTYLSIATLAFLFNQQVVFLPSLPGGITPENDVYSRTIMTAPEENQAFTRLLLEDDLEVWFSEEQGEGLTELQYRSATPVQATLSNAFGQQWLNRNLDMSQELVSSSFALNRLPEGCYVLTITNENHEVRIPIRR